MLTNNKWCLSFKDLISKILNTYYMPNIAIHIGDTVMNNLSRSLHSKGETKRITQ